MKHLSSNIAQYRQGKYDSGDPGKHKIVQCKHCKKDTRSDKLGRHIGQMHGEKATKKQKEAAKKDRSKKWITCDRCGASMGRKNYAKHLRSCTGRSVSSITDAGH